MRVLLANKFLYPKGGAERAVLELGAGLSKRGHEVFWFGMDHPSNVVESDRCAVVRQRDGLLAVCARDRMIPGSLGVGFREALE